MSQTDQHSVRVSDGRDTRKDRLEFNKLRKRLRRQTGKAIADFNMIEAGDRIMVCISGGKDSHAMLELLISLRSSAPIDFEIVAVTRVTATISKSIGALDRNEISSSSMAWESLPPEIHTIMRSPASIMLKSAMALPVCRRNRLRSLLNSSRSLRVSLPSLTRTLC